MGSYFNIPIAELPEREVKSGQVIDFFGMRYVVPLVADWPRTVIAVNIGGAVIPSLLSLYLVLKNRIWSAAAVSTLVVTIACYLLATCAWNWNCYSFACSPDHRINCGSTARTHQCGGSRICQRKFRNLDRRGSPQSWQDSGIGSSGGLDWRRRYL
jgi:Protein of unknown function (DUF1614)